MPSKTDVLSFVVAAHRVTRSWLAILVVCWLAVIGFASVGLPLHYSYEALRHMASSGVVVGLVLPLSVTAVILDEGPYQLVAGASRSLVGARVVTVGLYTVTVLGVAVLVATVAPVAAGLLVVDAMFLAMTALIGVSMMGLRFGWLVPLGLVLVASAPGLIPWQANLLYRIGHSGELALITVALLVVGTVCYARFGSGGVRARRALQSSRGALTE